LGRTIGRMVADAPLGRCLRKSVPENQCRGQFDGRFGDSALHHPNKCLGRTPAHLSMGHVHRGEGREGDPGQFNIVKAHN